MMTTPRRMALLIDELWKELASAPEHPASRRVDEIHPFDLFALIGPMGEPGLLLVTIEKPPVPRQYNAVVISRSLRPDSRWILLVQLRRNELRPLFAALCHDLIESSRKVPDKVFPSEFLMQRLERWKRLMEAARSDLLSPEELRGLMGELLLLAKVAIPQWGPDAAVSGWQGPFEAPHDFTFSDVNIEVKTLFPGATRIRVSSLEQLETFSSRLVLAIMVLAPALKDTKDSITPAGLVKYIKSMLDTDEALSDFQMRLAAVGYVDRDEYEEMSFHLQKIRFFEVSDSFPRIRKLSVPPGIDSVSYNVDLTFCGQLEITGLEGE
jgi:hypothetical protein